MPGLVTAQVTPNVYASPTGRILFIPQSSRLIGDYDIDVDVAFGQSRTLLVWNRLILPDGRSIVLERQPASDPRGFAGFQDGTDYHCGGVLKAALVSTLLTALDRDVGYQQNLQGIVAANARDIELRCGLPEALDPDFEAYVRALLAQFACPANTVDLLLDLGNPKFDFQDPLCCGPIPTSSKQATACNWLSNKVRSALRSASIILGSQ